MRFSVFGKKRLPSFSRTFPRRPNHVRSVTGVENGSFRGAGVASKDFDGSRYAPYTGYGLFSANRSAVLTVWRAHFVFVFKSNPLSKPGPYTNSIFCTNTSYIRHGTDEDYANKKITRVKKLIAFPDFFLKAFCTNTNTFARILSA